MINQKSIPYLCTLLFLFPFFCQAKPINQFRHPFYVGALGGFGSTTWFGLVPSEDNQNIAITMSTPINAQEGGQVWGVLGGYEFSPFFAIEGNYVSYPRATVVFDPFSIFSFNNNGATLLTTDTEALSLVGKVMLVIPKTEIRVFSGVGVANVHRQDIILDDWRASPTFSFGVNFPITEHFMGELAGNYTAGFGESQLDPTDSYFPFLYSATLRLAYRF
ncbi:hypothetical protein [Legionella fallonii]|uniref:Outer membrane protein OmpA-like transmembrane domain-containing protein n=1 Tax=Legionella fallonii LLAP-10 TaxID=1212491 RepID=A0A098G4C5_9GAMM|nr:hypothetical protein [Legionella fallonii]CEG56330.1 conserved exported protein of unknown function [OmpA_membrane] [Legionella fallonii LLAP-10]